MLFHVPHYIVESNKECTSVLQFQARAALPEAPKPFARRKPHTVMTTNPAAGPQGTTYTFQNESQTAESDSPMKITLSGIKARLGRKSPSKSPTFGAGKPLLDEEESKERLKQEEGQNIRSFGDKYRVSQSKRLSGKTMALVQNLKLREKEKRMSLKEIAGTLQTVSIDSVPTGDITPGQEEDNTKTVSYDFSSLLNQQERLVFDKYVKTDKSGLIENAF